MTLEVSFWGKRCLVGFLPLLLGDSYLDFFNICIHIKKFAVLGFHVIPQITLIFSCLSHIASLTLFFTNSHLDLPILVSPPIHLRRYFPLP